MSERLCTSFCAIDGKPKGGVNKTPPHTYWRILGDILTCSPCLMNGRRPVPLDVFPVCKYRSYVNIYKMSSRLCFSFSRDLGDLTSMTDPGPDAAAPSPPPSCVADWWCAVPPPSPLPSRAVSSSCRQFSEVMAEQLSAASSWPGPRRCGQCQEPEDVEKRIHAKSAKSVH